MARIVPFTKNREVVYDLLTRAKRFHCPVTTTWELDVEALEAARRRVRVNGRVLGLTACLARATALTVERHPKLNHHLFHGLLRKYEVAFEEIRCQLVIVRRTPSRERILLPLIIERANERSAVEIQEVVDHHRFAPLEELPQFAAFERLKRLPRFVLSWLSYKVRSDHRVYARYFGTYGLSTLTGRGVGPLATSTYANTCAAFVVGGVTERAQVRGGQVVAAKVLPVAFVTDHYLLDGLDMVEPMTTLRALLRDPTRLGLPGPEPRAEETSS